MGHAKSTGGMAVQKCQTRPRYDQSGETRLNWSTYFFSSSTTKEDLPPSTTATAVETVVVAVAASTALEDVTASVSILDDERGE